MKKPTPEELAQRREQVRRLFPNHSYSEIAATLGVTRPTIVSDCLALNLEKTMAQRSLAIAKGRTKASGQVFWSAEMVEILELMYPVMTTADVAVLLGINSDAVSNKAYSLRLKKRRKTPKATQTAPPKPKASAAPPLAYRGPPPMTAAQIAQREQQRITYPPDQLPWKARVMWGTTGGLPDLSHRSS